MGWNDRLDAPDAWEAFVDSQWEKADRDRKREREDVLFLGERTAAENAADARRKDKA